MRIALLMAMVVLTVFGLRLVQLQGVDASSLAAQALAKRSTDIALPAHRGDILDRTGAVLATTVERRNITVDQNLVPQWNAKLTKPPEQTGVAGAANALAGILPMTVPEITAKLTGTRKFAFVAKGVEPEVWRQVARLDITGIYSQQASRRTYPAGQVGANVVGFINSTGEPQVGVERAQQDQLKGVDGKLTYERGSNGQQIATGVSSETDPVDGRDVQLTLDRDLQWRAQDEVAKAVKATGARSGQAVIMRPDGDVLGLVSVPTFDPNSYGKAAAADLTDGALSNVFEPGSTSKVITAAAAMEEGQVKPSTRMSVDGTIRRGGRTFHDSHSHGVEKMTFAGVLAQSSNVGTIKAGERIPAEVQYTYLRRFGLGARTGVGLGESAGILAPWQNWNNSQRYTVMFGQGLSVTALQSASVFATIANDGVRATPRIVKAETGPDGRLVETGAGPAQRAVSPKTASNLRLMLESVVSDRGTAVDASVPGYRVAGKTGTAQRYDDDCGCYRGYTASFVGMAPADDPKLVVAVFLQDPKRNYYGGASAAPVFQKLMTSGLARLGIQPTGTRAPKVPLEWR